MTENALRDAVVGAGLLAGSANVIMQLSRAPVGYGVLESRVDSGNLFRHPVKRTRTTLTYLAVATMGTDAERAAYRRAVNRAHAQVHSTESSPVAYNAFDTDLQLWVAACLYKGFEDVYLAFVGGDPEPFYRDAAKLGTTLQVQPEMWPADREAFEKYWLAGLDEVAVDDTVRRYLTRILDPARQGYDDQAGGRWRVEFVKGGPHPAVPGAVPVALVLSGGNVAPDVLAQSLTSVHRT